jgi:hypothetical protein
MLLPIVTVNAASASIEIISIEETSGSSVEITFNSKIPRKYISHFTITASPDLSKITQSSNASPQQNKQVSKKLNRKATGLIVYEFKPIAAAVSYTFKVCAKSITSKTICSDPIEYPQFADLFEQISRLPFDWGNPKPIQLPSPVATAAPVAVPAAAKVAVTRASVGTSPGVAFTTQPQITIQDSSGNTITSSSAVVTATVSTGGTLIGTATATASSGVATFSNLGIRGFGGDAYTVTYTASGLTPATQTVSLTALTRGANGPGGGQIYYVATTNAGFTCGPTRNETCYYLEVAPDTWKTPKDDAAGLLTVRNNDIPSISGIPIDATQVLSADAIGLGYQNSLALFSDSRATNASGVREVRNYNGGSLSDWYVPSASELNVLCQWAKGDAQAVTTNCRNGGSITNGGFNTANQYWSSSQATLTANYYGWIQMFTSGVWAKDQWSDGDINIRPIRAF